MRTVTAKQMQDQLDTMFDTESFLTFEVGGMVHYNQQPVGIWEDLDSGHIKVALFLEGDNDPEYVRVKKETSTMTSEEKDMDKDYDSMTSKELAEVAKELKIKGRSKMTKFGLLKAIKEQTNTEPVAIDQLIPAFDQGAVTNPESTQRGVAKIREALDNKEEEDMDSCEICDAVLPAHNRTCPHSKEYKEEQAVLEGVNVFYCNVWTRANKTIYYFTQKWENVNRTRDDLVARAEGALGRKQNKAVVMQIGDKWVVITKVVKDGELITKSVWAETMDLRQNMRK